MSCSWCNGRSRPHLKRCMRNWYTSHTSCTHQITHSCANVHTPVHTEMYVSSTHRDVCTHTDTLKHAYTRVHCNTHVHTYTHTCTYKHMHMNTRVQTHIHTNTCTSTYPHTNTHKDTHTCIHLPPSLPHTAVPHLMFFSPKWCCPTFLTSSQMLIPWSRVQPIWCSEPEGGGAVGAG